MKKLGILGILGVLGALGILGIFAPLLVEKMCTSTRKNVTKDALMSSVDVIENWELMEKIKEGRRTLHVWKMPKLY